MRLASLSCLMIFTTHSRLLAYFFRSLLLPKSHALIMRIFRRILGVPA